MTIQVDLSELKTFTDWCRVKDRLPAEAIATYEQAIQLQPEYACSWYNKACHYAENEEVAEAIFNLQRALELNPDFADLLTTDKSFDCLRDRQEFQQLLKN